MSPQKILDAINSIVPITWDKFEPDHEGKYTIYCGLKEENGERSFLTIWFNKGDGLADVEFMTDSIKYADAFSNLVRPKHKQ